MSQRSVAVVGGGLTGLVAARSLARAGARVTVFESSERPGGQVHTVDVAGHPVDVGAEALHAAGPYVGELLADLGLEDSVVHANPGSAWIWTERGLRRLPAGVGPAGPTRLGPVVRSGILGPIGLARAAMEPFVPERASASDTSVGAFLSRRFGAQLTDRLVDPLLGSLHAGDISRLSLQSATPYLAARAQRHRSLLLGGKGPTPAAPSFLSFPKGLRTLVDALVANGGFELRLGVPIETLAPSPHRVEIRTADGAGETFDAAVLAVPAHVAAALLRSSAVSAASRLGEMHSASVVTVVAGYPRAAAEATPALRSTGLLVPSSMGRLLKAATFLSNKWPHLDDPDLFLVRLSAGRAGSEDPGRRSDPELVAQLHADLASATGLSVPPSVTHVQRWPRTMAQLEVGHRDRLAAIAGVLEGLGPVVLAGAPYDGVGLATCIRAGDAAADRLLAVREVAVGATS